VTAFVSGLTIPKDPSPTDDSGADRADDPPVDAVPDATSASQILPEPNLTADGVPCVD
jgi:hypothetical protein